MTDSLREIAHRFLGSCVWQCEEVHTEDCDALVKAIHSHTQALVAAAYAACAEHLPPLPDATLVSCSCGAYFSSRAAWQAHIRALTPADAAWELERRALEAVLGEATWWKQFSPNAWEAALTERVREYEKRLASLSKPAPVERSNENE